MIDRDGEGGPGPREGSLADDRAPVPQTVARRLQDMIRRGELPPESRLPSQRALAERLGVSRASLREALHTLETLGLVRTYPARGTIVCDAAQNSSSTPLRWRFQSLHSLEDAFQSRVLIEGELARLAAPRMTRDEIDALERANEEFARCWNDGDLVAHVEADLAFHSTIAQACPNRMLREIYLSLRDMLAETQRQPIPATETARMAESIAEHRDIHAALAHRDAPAARDAIRWHITNTARAAGLDLA